jgi:antitoxin (DNA-binding transcriptional repressor) of toxin-antitoxin stability system
MTHIPAAKFRQQCLQILDLLDAEGIIITRHGKPVAILQPIRAKSAALIGSMKGKIRVKGDILSTGLHWAPEEYPSAG